MTPRFSGTTALVVGGTSGIGLAIVQLLAAEGARVVFCGRREAEGRAIEADLREQNLQVLYQRCDVTVEADLASVVAKSLEWGGRLDAAVNCAGISPRRARLIDSSAETYDAVFAVNVRGTLLAMKHQMRAMEPHGGSIVNIASVLGIRAINLNHAIYTASKHAVVGLTKTAALEGAPFAVRVNAVCPGGIETPIHETNSSGADGRQRLAALHPLGRLGSPEEVAGAVAYLLSPGAGFLTGTIVSVDGGASL